MSQGDLRAGPFTHEKSSIARTMMLVMLALLPATAFGFYQFGWPALFLWLSTIGAAVATEAVCLRIAGKPIRPFVLDGSALLTAWLLAMTLPPWAPWWIGVVGGIVAILIGKQVFGGLGQNLFNPAMVARVVLLISFPLEMTTWVSPKPLFSAEAPDFLSALAITFGGGLDIDSMSSASILGHVKTELGRNADLAGALAGSYDPIGLLVGTVPGSLGETSALLLLGGGLFLLAMRIISWHIPLAMLGSLALCATLFNLIDPAHYPNALYHVLSGGALLGAFFIATDPVTSPVTVRGQLLFGALLGLLVYVIRTWASFPEGVAFAVMLANGLTPLIDHYLRPRIYGRTRKGQPISYAETQEGGNG